MLPQGKSGAGGRQRAIFRSVADLSMVPWQVHGGTILLPVCPGSAICHSHYCECLYCPDAGGNAERRMQSTLRSNATDDGSAFSFLILHTATIPKRVGQIEGHPQRFPEKRGIYLGSGNFSKGACTGHRKPRRTNGVYLS